MKKLSVEEVRPPFDVSKLLEGIGEESDTAAPHDTTGEGPMYTSISKRRFGSSAVEDIPPPPIDDPGNAPEAPAVPELAEDPINPSHYRRHPSGIECIEVTRHMNFNVGNAVKYLWRYLDKGDPIENLQKAQWYIDDEIRRLQGIR